MASSSSSSRGLEVSLTTEEQDSPRPSTSNSDCRQRPAKKKLSARMSTGGRSLGFCRRHVSATVTSDATTSISSSAPTASSSSNSRRRQSSSTFGGPGEATSSSSSRSKERSPRKRAKVGISNTWGDEATTASRRSRRLRRELRRSVLDEEPGDLRRKVRELEEARARLEAKDDERKRHIWMLEAKYKDANKLAKNSGAKIDALKEEVKKLKKDKTKRVSQLSEAIAEVKSLRQRMEKVEIDKALAESVKTNVGGSSSEGFFQDILHNFKELMETNLQCSICNELFISVATVRCGHSFCEECIEEWRAKKEAGRPNCPICRQDINTVATNSTLDTYIEKAVDLFFPHEAKTARAALAAERNEKRETRRARVAAQANANVADPVAGPSHLGGRRRRRHPAGGRSGGSIRILLSRAPPSRPRGRRDIVHDDDTSSTDLDWTPRGTHNRPTSSSSSSSTAHSPSTTESASSDSGDHRIGHDGTSPVVAETPSPYGLGYLAARGTSPGYDSRWRWQEEEEEDMDVRDNYHSIDDTMAGFNTWSDEENDDGVARENFVDGVGQDLGQEPDWAFSD